MIKNFRAAKVKKYSRRSEVISVLQNQYNPRLLLLARFSAMMIGVNAAADSSGNSFP
jgi:hypothetical protein